ncbi:dihydroneopterin aldolase [Magnetospira sp. QH-2]|uniref:dihydroneopterin aldolase n=1 Tax=Magnetospira sp. (strain QH-2) TaxID=1288970 RepID=UPI0003E80EC3|nr:dihydroneopterin aldolase [Magnetospira sp. QH-2]CCQ74860.1 putative dihydroneopterin aldolase [Magnetospira sp. QH-2]
MTAGAAQIIQPQYFADARNAVRHVFIRDLVLPCSIGIHDHEKTAPQRIRINLDLAVSEETAQLGDDIRNVVCYEGIANGIRDLVSSDHVNLVETLAEQVAEMCFSDSRVRVARVRIEKLDVFQDATSAGVEIERINQNAAPESRG